MKILNLLLFLIILTTPLFSLNISKIDIDSIRNNPSIIYQKYQKYKNEIDIGNQSEDYIIFCMQCAYQMAPYGYSAEFKLSKLLKEKFLNCGNYGYFACLLAECGNKDLFRESIIYLVGNDHGCVGNHQIIFINGLIFCDPTCGFYSDISFEELYRGQKIYYLYDWKVRGDIDGFRSNVKNSLINGLFKKSDIIYFKTFDEFLN